MSVVNDDTGPVQRHLDDMFDALAGTGAGGRRLLAEAEEHLRAATAEARDRGLEPDRAEQEAVARFGPARIAGAVPVHRTSRLMPFVVSGWAIVGIATLGAGAAAVLGRAAAYGIASLVGATNSSGVFDALTAGLPATGVAVLLAFLGSTILGSLIVVRHRFPASAARVTWPRLSRSIVDTFGLAAAGLAGLAVLHAVAGPWSRIPADVVFALMALAVRTVAVRCRGRSGRIPGGGPRSTRYRQAANGR